MYKSGVVFLAACAGMFLFGIGLITLGSIAPDQQEKFQLDEISAGTLFSILPFGILTGSLLFGPLCDRYGYKILLVISCFGMCAGFEGIAFAPSTAWLKVCIYLFGVSAGAINGATNALVSDISKNSKGANLSLLGVFFGIGALGMPFVLGRLKNIFSYEEVLAYVGLFTLLIGISFLFIKFPLAKSAEAFSFAKNKNLFKDPVLIFIAFFLFCQSSFEAIINNWTTSYLIRQLKIPESQALYALSLYLIGMTGMRLLAGTTFRKVSATSMLIVSLVITLAGTIVLHMASSFAYAVTGLVLLGVGLASGFPLMLGFVGNRYSKQSGTAFSFVLVVALLGNMIINYLMGLIANAYGIEHLTTMAFAEFGIMIILSTIIFRKMKNTGGK